MATVSEYLNDAAQYIGYWGDYNEFNRWYWCDLNGYDYNPGWAWCACFQSYVGVHDLGMPFAPSASAAGVAWQGEWVNPSDARAGDWVLFNWDGRQDFGWADHIGVVEWTDINDSGYFGTIEGNTGNSEVARCTRYIRGGYAVAFFRPPYDEGDNDMTPWQAEQLDFIYNHLHWNEQTHYSDMGNLVAQFPVDYPTIDDKGKEQPHTAPLEARIGYIDQRVHVIENKLDEILKAVKK